MKKQIFTIIFILLALIISAEENKHSVSGSIYFKKTGTIIIYLGGL